MSPSQIQALQRLFSLILQTFSLTTENLTRVQWFAGDKSFPQDLTKPVDILTYGWADIEPSDDKSFWISGIFQFSYLTRFIKDYDDMITMLPNYRSLSIIFVTGPLFLAYNIRRAFYNWVKWCSHQIISFFHLCFFWPLSLIKMKVMNWIYAKLPHFNSKDSRHF